MGSLGSASECSCSVVIWVNSHSALFAGMLIMKVNTLKPGEIGKVILDIEACNEEFDGGIPEHVFYDDLKDVADEADIKQLIERAIDLNIVSRLSPRLLLWGPGLDVVRKFESLRRILSDEELREIDEYTFDPDRRSERWKRDFILRCLKFRDERLHDIEAGATFIPLPLGPPPRVALHVTPGTPLHKDDYSLESYIAESESRNPIEIGWPAEERFEGGDYRLYAYGEATATALSYLQVFRDGRVEFVRANLSAEGALQLPMKYERDVIKILHWIVSVMENVGIYPPLGITLTLSGARGCRITSERGFVPGGRVIEHNRIQSPVVQVLDSEFDQTKLASLMKDTFDHVWRDAGYPNGSRNYDEHGVWSLS